MGKFIGPRKAAEARRAFLREVVIPESEWGDREKLRLADFIERTIARSVGPAAARVIVEGYLSSLGSRMEDVFDLFGRISSSLEESEQQLKRRVLNSRCSTKRPADWLLLFIFRICGRCAGGAGGTARGRKMCRTAVE